ncbi:serine/threonine-protein kinase [Phytohabitans houttuyneae]|uniref:serine/threonine-protein kinase n=1 Tax=Phytohabitans houttuyneae TaxID=1076126 RepID=UPI0031EA760E
MIAPAQIGSYRIERLLGVGSFATVWLGFDPALGARVAIKVLADNWSHDLRVRERFLDEGRLLWRLDHRRIVRVYSLGELPDGRPYLVMLWADGGSLSDRLAAGPLPVGQGLWLLREIAAGVAVLHANGIVHRDLTPGNVLLRSQPAGTEQVMIADLGLAKAIAAASGLTARAGTPGYMAPEQDDPLAVVDTRTDVYGLGRLGARLLGRPAAGGLDTGRLRDGVPEKVAGVLATATARLPADRYRDAAAFSVALGRATTARSATAMPVGTIAVPRRRRAVALASVLAAAVVVSVASDSVGSPRGRPPLSRWTRPAGSRSRCRRAGVPPERAGMAAGTRAGHGSRPSRCHRPRTGGKPTRWCRGRSSGCRGRWPGGPHPRRSSPDSRTRDALRRRYAPAGRRGSSGSWRSTARAPAPRR